MKILKRAAALTCALIISLSIVVKPVKASAFSGAITAGAITAGSVWGAVAGGLGIGLAVGANAIADGLDNGTIDNRVEQWLCDKASEWEYGYTQAQVNGEIYNAELTYGDLKALAALLAEAYPEGQITTSSGSIRSFSDMSAFRVPLDQPVYITDLSQHGETAVSYCLELYSSNERNNKYVSGPANINIQCSEYALPSGEMKSIVSGSGSVNSLPMNYGEYVSAYIIFKDGVLTVEYTIKDDREAHYNGTFTKGYNSLTTVIQAQFNDEALITTALPTFVPGVGVGSASSADIQSLIDSLESVPFGMTDSDVAVSIPVTGEDEDEDSKPVVRPGEIPEGDELIDEVPAAEIEGDFSNFTLPNGLMYVFPFSLPYDFYRGIKLFSADPEVPEFTFNFTIPYPSGMGNGNLVDEEITINFKQFEKLAIISRWITTFAFTMLLIKLSAFILKGGNA